MKHRLFRSRKLPTACVCKSFCISGRQSAHPKDTLTKSCRGETVNADQGTASLILSFQDSASASLNSRRRTRSFRRSSLLANSERKTHLARLYFESFCRLLGGIGHGLLCLRGCTGTEPKIRLAKPQSAAPASETGALPVVAASTLHVGLTFSSFFGVLGKDFSLSLS